MIRCFSMLQNYLIKSSIKLGARLSQKGDFYEKLKVSHCYVRFAPRAQFKLFVFRT